MAFLSLLGFLSFEPFGAEVVLVGQYNDTQRIPYHANHKKQSPESQEKSGMIIPADLLNELNSFRHTFSWQERVQVQEYITEENQENPHKKCTVIMKNASQRMHCKANDEIPWQLIQDVKNLQQDECDKLSWGLRSAMVFLGFPVGNVLKALNQLEGAWPSVTDMLFSENSKLLFMLDCIKHGGLISWQTGVQTTEKVAEQSTGEESSKCKETVRHASQWIECKADDALPHQVFQEVKNLRREECDKLSWGLRNALVILGSPVGNALEMLNNLEDPWPTVADMLFSEESNLLYILDCIRHTWNVLGIQGSVQAQDTYERGGRVRQEIYDLATDFSDVNNINYHGSTRAQEVLEYYIDKEMEETMSKSLPRSSPEECPQCTMEADWNKLQRKADRHPDTGKLMSGARKTADIKVALVYVVMNFNSNSELVMKDLLLALHCLNKHWIIPKQHFDTIVLHSGVQESELAWLSDNAPMPLILKQLKDSEVSEGEDHGRYGCRCPAWAPRCWDVTWLRAARVFSRHMFNYLEDYEYFIRLDSDIFFIKRPPLDAAKIMIEHGCVIAYHRISVEAPGCFDGFRDFIKKLAADEDLQLPHEADEMMQYGQGIAVFGGQWTVGDLRLFGSRDYQILADAAKESGMFEHRWADQLIFAAATILLAGSRICFHDMFQDNTLFIHKKLGFQDLSLVEQCDLPNSSVFASYPMVEKRLEL